MTAKDLKAPLAKVSDDMEIHIRIEPIGSEVKATEVTQVIRPGGLSLFIVNGVLSGIGDRTWTKEKPTEPDWYWYRATPTSTPEPIRLSDVTDQIAGFDFGGYDSEHGYDQIDGEFAKMFKPEAAK